MPCSKLLTLIFLSIALIRPVYSQNFKIIKSDYSQIIIELDFGEDSYVRDTVISNLRFSYISSSMSPAGNPGEPNLPAIIYNVGIPADKIAILKYQYSGNTVYHDKFILPFPDSSNQVLDKLNYNAAIYNNNALYPLEVAKINDQFNFRYIKIASLVVSPFQFNPVTRTLQLAKKIIVQIDFKDNPNFEGTLSPISDSMTEELVKNTLINPDQAISFIRKRQSDSDSPLEKYWYDPNKNYYKIYLNGKGVYRLTYDQLDSLNIPINNIDIDKFEIFNEGLEIPLYIKDSDQNHQFTQGDYIEFIGFPPKPSPYSYLNIYNTQNVYWFSYQADSVGKRYEFTDGYPDNWSGFYYMTPYTIHFEKDSIYERLGHAHSDQRDYWFWGKSSGTDGNLTSFFSAYFSSPPRLRQDASHITVRVNMHGITTNDCLIPDHKAKIYLTSQLIGEHVWDGPNSTTFQTDVDLSAINIYADNNFQVAAYGDIPINPCDTNAVRSDEIRINWFEIEYPREHRAYENNFTFFSPPNVFNKVLFSVFNWQRDNIKIFVPQKSRMIINANITNDEYLSVLFVDSLTERTEYFCSAEDYYLRPDSIKSDSHLSNLRNHSNGADYLIITHSKFFNAAQELAEFRTTHFPDSSIHQPRISVVDISDIYDEFSYGLLNPYAIKDFIAYAFNNWTTPSLDYVVLFGDMSYDYRSLLSDSRPNFIPSLPYHVSPYGQSVSDNNLVCIVGNDITPDLAIGRLSCETQQEASILLEKIKNYPNDYSKSWKQNVLLMSSGQNQEDENNFQFNNSNIYLENTYLKPNGLVADKVFRFPTDTSHFPFQGGGPEIRRGINKGAVVASYYGHGGGYQWDLVFNNDDILLLNNEYRLPFITSVTCYTAHFDNQDVFGEQFNKVPGKGSIAFWGSSGLTFWYSGKQLNEKLFGQLFTQKIYIIGKAILNAKSSVPSNSQVALLTLLGDPVLSLSIPDKPDFVIKPTDISVFPPNPKKDDTVSVMVKVNNLGITFPNRSISVELVVSSKDTSYSVDTLWMNNFGEIDSVNFMWYPAHGGLYNLEIAVNEINSIPEMDKSDNLTSTSQIVYDLDEPNIVLPINGYIFHQDSVKFVFVDPGYYSSTDLEYFIEIDTSLLFTNPIIKSEALHPSEGILTWQPSGLSPGNYLWRSRMFSYNDSSNWSDVRIFSISDSSLLGYYVSNKQLKSLSKSNIIYSDSLNSLVLNVDYLPPRPSNNKLIDFIDIDLPPDLMSLSSITTDGTFIYCGHMSYYSGNSKIYKFGTGFNGTVFGANYGEIPNLSVPIWHSIVYYKNQDDGALYVATGDAFSLLKINPITGDSVRVPIPEGLINSIDSKVEDGAFFLSTDGRFVYNAAYINELGHYKYKIRKFDPQNGWEKIGDDITPNGSSFDNFKGFFMAENYFYPYENYQEGWLRRINLISGDYEEEWKSYEPFQGFYSWAYDWVNDVVYASVFKNDYSPKIAKFIGKYLDGNGNVSTPSIGPAVKWNKLSYRIENENSEGIYTFLLLGLNKSTNNWDTLALNPEQDYDLRYLDADHYHYLKSKVSIVDTSFGLVNKIRIKNIGITYLPPPEIKISNNDISFFPDTLLQGLNTVIKTKISNIGYGEAKNVKLNYSIKDHFSQTDSVLFFNIGDINRFSNIEFIDTLNTAPYLFENYVEVKAEYQNFESFLYNNFAKNYVYVKRDSINPTFEITFDGRELIDGDIISSEPTVIITVRDNSPLPLTSNMFTILHNNELLNFYNLSDSLKAEYTAYPNSKFVATWTPKLEDGEHSLSVIAKDSSGNFINSTAYVYRFFVYNNPDLLQVYNYPNPFKDKTEFTFELRGVIPPEEVKIKVFTVAGRLIKEMTIPGSGLQIGFNRIPWDGKDQDGDEIANGVYLYKIISKHGDKTMVTTQKLAKLK